MISHKSESKVLDKVPTYRKFRLESQGKNTMALSGSATIGLFWTTSTSSRITIIISIILNQETCFICFLNASELA